MTLVALHNGGGVGIGKSINGGFGLVRDGSKRVDEIIKSGPTLGRNEWRSQSRLARNENSISTGIEFNQNYAGQGHITLPYVPEEDLIDQLVEKAFWAKR